MRPPLTTPKRGEVSGRNSSQNSPISVLGVIISEGVKERGRKHAVRNDVHFLVREQRDVGSDAFRTEWLEGRRRILPRGGGNQFFGMGAEGSASLVMRGLNS